MSSHNIISGYLVRSTPLFSIILKMIDRNCRPLSFSIFLLYCTGMLTTLYGRARRVVLCELHAFYISTVLFQLQNCSRHQEAKTLHFNNTSNHEQGNLESVKLEPKCNAIYSFKPLCTAGSLQERRQFCF